jgi:hypothetical protein
LASTLTVTVLTVLAGARNFREAGDMAILRTLALAILRLTATAKSLSLCR